MSLPIFTPPASLSWRTCRKVRPIKAKPMVSIIVDRSVMAQFLLNTLEAKEPISPDAVMCVGDAGDAWQQTPRALLKNYNVTSLDKDGWMICEPKPEELREFVELTFSMLEKHSDLRDGHGLIVGTWGEEIDGVPNLQRFKVGDFLLRQREDSSDQWIVRRNLWLNTYQETAA